MLHHDFELEQLIQRQELIDASMSVATDAKIHIKSHDIFPDMPLDGSVKRGLRNANGTGVMAGVTAIGDVNGYDLVDGKKVPREGRLFYRGISVEDIVEECIKEDRYGFEEVAYLLLFGHLPTNSQLKEFRLLLARWSQLPGSFTEDIIMRSPSKNIMSKLQSCILTLYAHDEDPENMSLERELFRAFRMVARTPTIVSHAYASKRHYFGNDSLYLHCPQSNLSVAENLLYTLRKDTNFTDDEAKLLDLCMIMHAEHGGGNNSSFACRVLTSSGTDFYSAISAAVGSLKGYRHGGANAKVVEMMNYLKEDLHNWNDDGEVKDALVRIMNRDLGDGSGLIYGMGHAIYTLSDPRAKVLKRFSRELAEKKGRLAEWNLIEAVERLTPGLVAEIRHSDKPICANVDLYSGFVYQLLDIPTDMYTPLFASARMPGWCAHRIEECCGKDPRIIRPAYMTVCERVPYAPIRERK